MKIVGAGFVVALIALWSAAFFTQHSPSAAAPVLRETASPVVLLGDQNIETTKDGGTGVSEAFAYTASASGTAVSASVYLDSTKGMQIGLYADNGSNKPGARLDLGSVTTNTVGWTTVNLSGGVAITQGTRYWLAIASSTSANMVGYRDKGNGGSNLDWSGPSSTLSNPFVSSHQWTSNPASVYVSGSTPAGNPPTNNTPPVLGFNVVGDTLTAAPGSWDDPNATISYQWQDCDGNGANCTNISGATTKDYVVQTSDVGSTLVAQVTATNDGGSTQASSPPTAPVVSGG